MSVFKRKNKILTILDFSCEDKISKSIIKKCLRQVDIKYCSIAEPDGWITFFNNEIKVGMYTIRLELTSDLYDNYTKLKQYRGVRANVVQQSNVIDLQYDSRFSYKSWNSHNISIDELADLICHCKKLHDMRVFL